VSEVAAELAALGHVERFDALPHDDVDAGLAGGREIEGTDSRLIAAVDSARPYAAWH
jgi:hypothetical protein